MALSRKQKQHIRAHYHRDSVQTLAHDLQLDAHSVEDYVRAAGLGRAADAAAVRRGAARSLLYSPKRMSLALAALAAVVGWYCFDPLLYISGDNVEFMWYAEQLRQGQFSLGNGKFPFGFPAMLAVVQWLSGNSLIAQKILVLLFYIAAAPLTYLLVRRRMSHWWGAAGGFLFLAAPLAIEFSHYVMSEMPYLTISLLAVVLLLKADDQPDRRVWFWGGLAVMVASYYLRSVALALMAAVVLHYLTSRQWRRSLIAAGVSLLGILPLSIANQLQGGNTYFRVLFQKNPYDPAQGMLNLQGLLSRIGHNASVYFEQDFPLMGFPLQLETTLYHLPPYPAGVAWLLSAILAAACVAAFLRKDRLSALYTVCTTGILLLWPEVWSGERFAVPLLPFIVLYVLFAVYLVVHMAGRYAGKTSGIVTGVLCVGVLIVASGRNILRFNELSQPGDAWLRYYEAADWVRENTPPETVVCDRKGTLFGYISGRRSIWIPQTPDTREVLKFLYENHVDYVVISSIPYQAITAYLVPLVNAYSDRFSIVYQRTDPQTYVLKLNREAPLPE